MHCASQLSNATRTQPRSERRTRTEKHTPPHRCTVRLPARLSSARACCCIRTLDGARQRQTLSKKEKHCSAEAVCHGGLIDGEVAHAPGIALRLFLRWAVE
jgi:hypothetical protein